MDENPREMWKSLFHNAINEFGFAEMIKKEQNCAYICSCVFYDRLQKDGFEPTEHPVCWVGWGLIEGFMKEFEGIQRIRWTRRDIENNRCQFDFIRNNEDLEFS